MEFYPIRRSIISSRSRAQNRSPDFHLGSTGEITPQLLCKLGNFVILGTSLILANVGYWIKEPNFQATAKHLKNHVCIAECPSTLPETAENCSMICKGSSTKFYSSELELTLITLSSISIVVMAIGIRTLYLEGRTSWVTRLAIFVMILTMTGGICMLLSTRNLDTFLGQLLGLQDEGKAEKAIIMSIMRKNMKYWEKIAAGNLSITSSILEMLLTIRYASQGGPNSFFPHVGRIHPENPNIIIVKQQEVSKF